ncbi:MAG: ACT domain-containing protein, partial [Acidobacteriota bacterium]
AQLEGTNILIQNLDMPGTIGFIGTTLGNYNVNIANLHLSRTPQKDRAICILRIDAEAPAEAIEAIRSNPNILYCRQVKF